MPFLEWGPSHLSMDTCLTVEVSSIIWDIIQANNQLLANHFLECILSKVGKSFVCKVERGGNSECHIMVGCHICTPFGYI